MNATVVLEWLEHKHFCISMLYLIPSVIAALILLIGCAYYCYLTVRECRRRAWIDKSNARVWAGNERAESIRQIHQNRQCDYY